jgi:hypothetical protein
MSSAVGSGVAEAAAAAAADDDIDMGDATAEMSSSST